MDIQEATWVQETQFYKKCVTHNNNLYKYFCQQCMEQPLCVACKDSHFHHIHFIIPVLKKGQNIVLKDSMRGLIQKPTNDDGALLLGEVEREYLGKMEGAWHGLIAT
ncbi:B-box-type zinc finger [Dillenia turbinata]|uniref:B-box-type zinc finger n=1 Tax=Dillenia turbinata TaxID=194707 RepID=A0AAN8UVH4_9MAGN